VARRLIVDTGVLVAAERAGRPPSLPIERDDEVVAEVHTRLLAHVQRTGRPRGAHDLIIAATASATGRMLLTTDARARFAELPGLTVVTR